MRDFSGILPIMERAGQMVLSAHDVDAAIRVKPGDANFVTDYDVAVQDFLYEELGRLLPEAVVIAEESEENHTELLASSLCLIIDPIDGTTNFIHNYRYSSI
ncbi:MAG: inositol monophosphatase, partial [Clostridia bacterium]|nr:inositol monophosphatase [Clostridia bacterium]